MNQLLAENGMVVVDDRHPMPSPDVNDMKVKYTCSSTAETIIRNIDLALERQLPPFFGSIVKAQEIVFEEGKPKESAWHVKWSKDPIALVAGGPTLRQTIDKVRDFKTVMVAGSAHDFVVTHGIIPDYAVVLDAIPQATGFLKYPQQATTYLLASQCDPSTFDHLKDYKVFYWNALGPPHHYRNEPSIGGGATTVLRCMEMAFLMGFWDLHFFGLDSCYAADGAEWSYENFNLWDVPQYLDVECETSEGIRMFKSDLGLVGQAEWFIDTFKKRKHIMKATVHGDNLISHTIKDDNGKYGIHVA